MERLREVIGRISPNVRAGCVGKVVRQVVRVERPSLVERNRRRYGYPPDKRDKATRTVLEQAEVICADIAA